MSLEHSPARRGSGKLAGTRPALLQDYLTRPELAAELDCSERTIARYEMLPDGLPSVSIGGRKFYHVNAVRDFIARRERKPNPVRKGAAT